MTDVHSEGFATCLVLLCKRPALGHGKQRLAKRLGLNQALQIARASFAMQPFACLRPFVRRTRDPPGAPLQPKPRASQILGKTMRRLSITQLFCLEKHTDEREDRSGARRWR